MSLAWRVAVLAVLICCAVGLGCRARSVTFQTGTSGEAAGAPAGIRMSTPQRSCQNSGDCMLGDECARPSGGTLGVCGTIVDASGRPVGRNMGKVPRCERREDCPDLFTCRRSPGWIEGLCVR
jgi:hypothetical protein